MTSGRESGKRVSEIYVNEDELFGRQAQLSQLDSSYRQFVSSDSERGCEVVLLGGPGGIGKSGLIRAFRKQIEASGSDHLFVIGKVEENFSASAPFSSVSNAFSEWIRNAMPEQLRKDEESLLKSRIQKAVGEEGRVLTNIIPSLIDLIGEQPQLDSAADDYSAVNRSKFLFVQLIKALASKDRPLVFVLEDIHWADQSTLDLVSLIGNNSSIENCMLVASYRDNESDNEETPFSRALMKLQSEARNIQEISLRNLKRQDCSRLVASALHMSSTDEVQDLTGALMEKTRGNPFHVQETLQFLHQRDILLYSHHSSKWEYDIAEVIVALSLAEGMEAVLTAKMGALDPLLQTILGLAAQLSSPYELDIVLGIFRKLDQVTDREKLVGLLDVAVLEGILENPIGTTAYKFRHDFLREAAKSLLPSYDVHSMLVGAGQYLLESIEDQSLAASMLDSEILFLALDLLNKCPLHRVNELMETKRLMELNVDAANSACQMSAYTVALRHLKKSSQLMESLHQPWEHNFDLCLRLHSKACSVQLAVGDFIAGKESYEKAVDNARSFEEGYPAKKAYSDGLGQRQRHAEALLIDRRILLDAGQKPLSSNIVVLVSQIFGVKKVFKEMTDEQILSVPMNHDPKHIAVLDTIISTLIHAFFCNQLNLSLIATIRGIHLSLKQGMTKASSYIFAAFGNICAMALADYDLGNRIITLGTELATKSDAKAYMGKILYSTNSYVKSWFEPLSKLIDNYHQAYQAAFASGDIEFACYSLTAYILYQLASGSPIDVALQDCKEMDGLLNNFQVESAKAIVLPLSDLIRTIGGQKEYTTMKPIIEQLPTKKLSDPSKSLGVLCIAMFGIQKAFYFGELDAADELRKVMDKYKDMEATFYAYSTFYMFSTLIGTSLFRKTGGRRHLKSAKKAVNETKKILAKRGKKGSKKGINLLHKYKIMDAVYCATVPGKLGYRDIKAKFDEAIRDSQRSGFIQDAALANELCGEYMLTVEEEPDDFWPKIYISKAHELYIQWGARGKAEHLFQKRKDVINQESVRSPGKSMTLRAPKIGLAAQAVEFLNTTNGDMSTLTTTQSSQWHDPASSASNSNDFDEMSIVSDLPTPEEGGSRSQNVGASSAGGGGFDASTAVSSIAGVEELKSQYDASSISDFESTVTSLTPNVERSGTAYSG